MTTKARFFALEWFWDHQAMGPNAIFDRKPPTLRMRNLMLKEGQIARLPLGQFDYAQWRLTSEGAAVLLNKSLAKQHRRSLPRIHGQAEPGDPL
jgi:hypothetical protein